MFSGKRPGNSSCSIWRRLRSADNNLTCYVSPSVDAGDGVVVSQVDEVWHREAFSDLFLDILLDDDQPVTALLDRRGAAPGPELLYLGVTVQDAALGEGLIEILDRVVMWCLCLSLSPHLRLGEIGPDNIHPHGGIDVEDGSLPAFADVADPGHPNAAIGRVGFLVLDVFEREASAEARSPFCDDRRQFLPHPRHTGDLGIDPGLADHFLEWLCRHPWVDIYLNLAEPFSTAGRSALFLGQSGLDQLVSANGAWLSMGADRLRQFPPGGPKTSIEVGGHPDSTNARKHRGLDHVFRDDDRVSIYATKAGLVEALIDDDQGRLADWLRLLREQGLMCRDPDIGALPALLLIFAVIVKRTLVDGPVFLLPVAD